MFIKFRRNKFERFTCADELYAKVINIYKKLIYVVYVNMCEILILKYN